MSWLTTSIVAPINIAFVVTSAPTGKSILKVSVSVKLSAHNPLHFLEISPTEIPPEFSICKRLNHSPKKRWSKSTYWKVHISSTWDGTTRSGYVKDFLVFLIKDFQMLSGATLWHFSNFPQQSILMIDFKQLFHRNMNKLKFHYIKWHTYLSVVGVAAVTRHFHAP